MAKLFYYHDTRSGKGPYPLKIRIYHNKGNAYLGLDIRIAPEQWDAQNEIVINHDNAKSYNARIRFETSKAETVIADLRLSGQLKKYSATQVKQIIENDGKVPEWKVNSGNFTKVFSHCIESKRKDNTRISYEQSLKRMREYDEKLDSRSFEDIDLAYIQSFDKWLSDRGVTQNSRNVYYRSIRAVFNHAIDNDITTAYPFRKFKMLKDYLPAVTQCSEDSILRLARRLPARWGFAPLADLLQLDQSQRILYVIPKNLFLKLCSTFGNICCIFKSYPLSLKSKPRLPHRDLYRKYRGGIRI